MPQADCIKVNEILVSLQEAAQYFLHQVLLKGLQLALQQHQAQQGC